MSGFPPEEQRPSHGTRDGPQEPPVTCRVWSPCLWNQTPWEGPRSDISTMRPGDRQRRVLGSCPAGAHSS